MIRILDNWLEEGVFRIGLSNLLGDSITQFMRGNRKSIEFSLCVRIARKCIRCRDSFVSMIYLSGLCTRKADKNLLSENVGRHVELVGIVWTTVAFQMLLLCLIVYSGCRPLLNFNLIFLPVVENQNHRVVLLLCRFILEHFLRSQTIDIRCIVPSWLNEIG